VRDQTTCCAALDTYVRLDLLGRTIRFAPMSGWRCSVVQRITHAHGPLHACVLVHAFMHAMREWSAGGRRRPSEIDRGHNIILSSCTCHLGRASASGELVVTMGQQPQKHVYRRCPQGVFVAGSHAGCPPAGEHGRTNRARSAPPPSRLHPHDDKRPPRWIHVLDTEQCASISLVLLLPTDMCA
jgi:hypothetical protein